MIVSLHKIIYLENNCSYNSKRKKNQMSICGLFFIYRNML
jgi:hypothetical protein